MNYDQRNQLRYKPGDKVTILPPYRMGGSYVDDGYHGPYTVTKQWSDGFCRLTPGDKLGPYVVSCHVCRLEPRE